MFTKIIASLVLGPAIALTTLSGFASATTDGETSQTSPISAEPNITGVWERYPSPFPEGLTDTEEIPAPNGGPDLKEPHASEWRAKRERRNAALKAGTPLVDASTNCLPEGTPGIMQAIYPIQILQTPGQITVLAELFMQTRRIYLDTPLPPADEIAPSYFGFSAGEWDGDTLIVRTRGVQKSLEFFEIPHGDEMLVTERFRLTAPDMLKLDITIEDPEYLNTPYHFTWEYKRNDEYRLSEYVCDSRLDVINPDGTVSMRVD